MLSKDMDTDSERDPFSDRSFDLPLDQLDRLYAPSDRDSRHKFNLAYGNLPVGMTATLASRRRRSRSRRPGVPTSATARKDNVLHVRLADHAPFRFGNGYE